MVADLLGSVPVLRNTDPENVFQFLVCGRQVYDLGLVTDEEFLTHIVTKTTGRLTQIVGAHLRLGSSWEAVSSEILSTSFPLRIRERFLSRFVLDRFQSATEELSDYVTSVVTAAKILQYHVAEAELVHRLIQNIHPNVRSQLIFVSEPHSIQELLSLASQVAEARAVDERRRALDCKAPNTRFQREGRDVRPTSMTVGEMSRATGLELRCWKCLGRGHFRRNCPSVNTPGDRCQGDRAPESVQFRRS